jgi:hypothetical protein
MAPLYRMPDPAARRREALVRELRAALAAARCALRLAAAGDGDGGGGAVVRELLRAARDVLDRAGAAARRLPG